MESLFKLKLEDQLLLDQFAQLGLSLWIHSKKGNYVFSCAELNMLEKFIELMRNEETLSEFRIQEICEEKMSIEEALLIASIIKTENRNNTALKTLGRSHSQLTKELITQQKLIRQLEGKLSYGR